MASAKQPKVENSGGMSDIINLFSGLNNLMGSGKTTQSSSTSVDAGALTQLDEILKQVMASVSPENLDALVMNIIQRGKEKFGEFAMASRGAGVRAYSDTVLQQMQGDIFGQAVADATKARLDAMNNAQRIAADIATQKVQSTRQTTQTQQTSASPAGKLLGGALVGSSVYKWLKKKDLLSAKGQEGVVEGGAVSGDITSGSDLGGSSGGVDIAGAGEFGSENALGFSSFDEAGFSEIFADPTNLALEDTLVGSGIDESGFISTEPALNDAAAAELADQQGEMAGNPLSASVSEGIATGIITPQDVITPLPMPPAIPIDPATGEAIPSMPPAIFDIGEEAVGEGVQVAAGGDIMTDVGPGLLEEGVGEAGEVAAEGAAETASAGVSEIIPGVGAAVVAGGTRAAYGDESGAAGASAGALLGGSLGGPLGAAAGATIGGALLGEEKQEIAYVYDRGRDQYLDARTGQWHPGRPPAIQPVTGGGGIMDQVFQQAQAQLEGQGSEFVAAGAVPEAVSEPTADWLAEASVVNVADFVAEVTAPALAGVEPVEIEADPEEELANILNTSYTPTPTSSGGGATRSVLR